MIKIYKTLQRVVFGRNRVMLFDQITPFVRFTAQQNMAYCWINDGKDIVGYDHRFYYVLSGEGTLTVDGKDYRLHPDSFIMWRAGVPYSYCLDEKNPLVCITCNFDFTAAANTLRTPVPPSKAKEFNPEKIIEKHIVFSDVYAFNDTVFIEEAAYIRRLVINLADAYSKKQKFYVLKCNNVLQEILFNIAYQTDLVLSRNSELVLAILDYVHKNFRSNPTNEDIGAIFGYHPNYINSLIVKHTKISLHRYVIECKLSHAMQLLLTSNQSISEIASAINMPDPQYFSKLFKKYYKKSPSAFRLNK